MALDQYYLLGHSGMRVSRLALGTMNLGTSGFHAAYGKTEHDVRPIFRGYLERGGNFIDTADFYTAGECETILGKLIAEEKVRGCAGWAPTTWTCSSCTPGIGSHRSKRCCEPSTTSSGPARSATPAWSPLGGGFLSGKYRYPDQGLSGDGRLSIPGASGLSLTERQWQLLKPLGDAADELAVTMAQVAINWSPLSQELRAELDQASAVPPESVYRMFTAGYQNLIISPGSKVGDKPASYLPAVRNWTSAV